MPVACLLPPFPGRKCFNCAPDGYHTATPTRTTRCSTLTFGGESFVCNPAGEILARAQEGTEEILYADINLNDVKNSHAQKLFLRDRRPELYCDWLGK